MFIQFETSKSEKVLVPISKILLIEQDKRGVTVVLDDGTPLLVCETIESVAKRLQIHYEEGVEREVITLK